MKLVCLSILLLVAVVQAGKLCQKTSECQEGECCQILRPYPIMSRRFISKTKISRTGTCEPYRHEGESCPRWGKMNGYCSCEPGTYCKTDQVPIKKTLMTRKIAPPKPGYKWRSRCTKK